MSCQTDVTVRPRYAFAIAMLTLAIAVVYAAQFAYLRMIPDDEGILAYSAEQVLRGGWPHIDYLEPYTGGQAFLHAAAFKLLGVKLSVLRVVALGLFGASQLAFYYICQRIVAPLAAAALTLLANVWSFPNYSAAMPSWYCIFLAQIALALVLRHVDTGKQRWLWLGGLALGSSFLCKITGLYALAAIVLALSVTPGQDDVRTTSLWQRVTKTIIAMIPVAAVAVIIWTHLSIMYAFHFLVPWIVVAWVYTWDTWAHNNGLNWRRPLPFVAGFALPILVFIIPYAIKHELGSLLDGWFVIPQRRIEMAFSTLQPLVTLLWAAPLALLLGAGACGRSINIRPPFSMIIALAVCALAVWFGGNEAVYGALWSSVRPAFALILIAGGVALFRSHQGLRTAAAWEFFLIAAAAGCLSLIQYPFSIGIYFLYVSSLLILAMTYLCRLLDFRLAKPLAILGLAAAAFAVIYLNTSTERTIGIAYHFVPQTAPLSGDRGGIWTIPQIATRYERLVQLINRVSQPGALVYAGPDAPEVNFLSATHSPEFSAYDIFGDGRPLLERLKGFLVTENLQVVVLNLRPEFSPAPTDDVMTWVKEQYQNHETIDHFFVAWKNP